MIKQLKSKSYLPNKINDITYNIYNPWFGWKKNSIVQKNLYFHRPLTLIHISLLQWMGEVISSSTEKCPSEIKVEHSPNAALTNHSKPSTSDLLFISKPSMESQLLSAHCYLHQNKNRFWDMECRVTNMDPNPFDAILPSIN